VSAACRLATKSKSHLAANEAPLVLHAARVQLGIPGSSEQTVVFHPAWGQARAWQEQALVSDHSVLLPFKFGCTQERGAEGGAAKEGAASPEVQQGTELGGAQEGLVHKPQGELLEMNVGNSWEPLELLHERLGVLRAPLRTLTNRTALPPRGSIFGHEGVSEGTGVVLSMLARY